MHDCKIGYAVACEAAPAPPSDPVAPSAKECTSTSGTIFCNDPACAAHGKPVAPSLLPRVLAEMEKWADYDEGEMHALAAELRRYIAENDDLLRECEGLIASCGQMAEQIGYASTEIACHAVLAKLQARTTPRSGEGEGKT